MKKILILGIIIYLGFWGRYMWIGSGEIEANQPRKLVGITATPEKCEWTKDYMDLIKAMNTQIADLKNYDVVIYEPELIYQECVKIDCPEYFTYEEENFELLKQLREEKLRYQLNCFK